MGSEQLFGDDHIANLLSGVARLLDGVVATAFATTLPTHSPVVWSTVAQAEVAAQLSGILDQRLADRGPWGPSAMGRGGTWSLWVEPVLGRDGGDDPGAGAEGDDPGAGAEGDGPGLVPVGALAAIKVGADQPFSPVDRQTLRLFAGLCAGATRVVDLTIEQSRQRRLDELVSRISERLMRTTLPTMPEDLHWTVETLCRFLGADAAFLRRNDHAAGMSILMAEYPRRDVSLEDDPLGVVPFDADPIFAATRDLKVPIIIQDISQGDERYAERIEEGTGHSNFSGAGVPLVHVDVTEGCLAFIYFSPIHWSEHDINALRAVAALLVQLVHRVDAEERLRRSALTDDLTGLANRRALLAEVEQKDRSVSKPLALLFLDLDRFKVMNDHLGHEAGDRVLQVIADRIRSSLRPEDFAARLGGDEFVVLLEDTGDGHSAVAAANRLLEIISMPMDIRGQHIVHTGSIGIAMSADKSLGGEEVLSHADIALYAAKAKGRNQTVVFDERLAESVAERSTTELRLRQALSERELRVHYQPEFDLRDGRTLAVEALVRWQQPGKPLLNAAEFIPVAEETHLIADIDRWVLGEACMQMAQWRRSFPRFDLAVRVNISPAQLGMVGLVEMVAEALGRSGLPPQLLCLEITEQAMISDLDRAVKLLGAVRAMGVKLALDDFGTGFSSMMQLKNLPVDMLKIDRGFVEGIETDPTDQAIVDAIIRLANAFHLDVVAEGAETVGDLRTLAKLGCSRAQGFVLAHPLPPGEVERLFDGIDLLTVGAIEPSGTASQ